jgi:hypothetical protein
MGCWLLLLLGKAKIPPPTSNTSNDALVNKNNNL